MYRHPESPVRHEIPGGYVCRDSGHSHFTVQSQLPGHMGTHITTQIPGLRQGMGISAHIPVDPMGNVGNIDFAPRW